MAPRLSSCFITSTCFALLSASNLQAEASNRPNILWICADDFAPYVSGTYRNDLARTPHLDALAAQSINATQAVTPHPFGPFARAALLTGVPSPENGVRGYFDPLPRYTPGAVAAAGNVRGLAVDATSTAKGGVLAAIARWGAEQGRVVPVYFIGIGEKMEDLQTFSAREFAQALLG